MITVADAKKIIHDNTDTIDPVQFPLAEAAGLTLAGDVFAAHDVPPFAQSSMDGYAFSFAAWQPHKKLKITGEAAAGSMEMLAIGPDTAARIFTGAVVPAGADTVVMQERVVVQNDELIIGDENLVMGANVRKQGAEIQAGSLALEKDSVLTPAAIGLLASVGVAAVEVYPPPAISIIVTGNELQQPGSPLGYGQIYESGSLTLVAALQQLHFTGIHTTWIKDDPKLIGTALDNALQTSDLVLLTGGVSVGDYDFTLKATEACGVQQLFHKIKQRPGKPLYFGKAGRKLVFGLPGNPASVLTCFYQYVVPALEKLGKRKPFLKMIKAPLSQPFQKNARLTFFLKGWYDGKTVTPLGAQESFRLSSFARANCLIRIEEDVMECKAGEMIDVYLLPG